MAMALVGALMLVGCGSDDAPPERAERENIDVCGLVTPEQLSKLYRKELLPNVNGEGCYWNQKPGGMAYMDIRVRNTDRSLRDFFDADIPASVTLEPITDLGDGGLMSITEGSIGVVVIEKDGRFLQSAVTFLDIEPNTPEQAVLWDAYRAVLNEF